MGTGSHSSKRKKKRSQKHSKKRSKSIREKKSKKLKRRHDSVSCSDDDNSVSTSSISQSDSSSEDNYRSRRRARSRDRKDTRKGSKKKKIKRNRDSSMSDSSEDSRSRRIRKRKRSKKKRDVDSRKKRHGKKNRKEPSSSSSSGHSQSLSRSEHSNDSSGELKRKEDKRELKEWDWEDRGGERIKRSRYSSRSCSPCSLRGEDHSYSSEERLMEENPPKRLKSVIVVLREIEEAEVGDLNREEPKDEIVYEPDDYPTRSNDSNEGIGRGEGLLNSHDACDERGLLLEEPNREAGSSDVRISELSTVQRRDVERTSRIGSSPTELGAGESTIENPSVSTAGASGSSNSVDLEVMLRQKALQNLLKRRSKLPTKNDGVTQGDKSESKNPKGGSFVSAQKVGRNDDAKDTSSVPELPKDSRVHPPIRKTETVVEKGSASTNPVISRPKMGLLTSTRRLLGSSNTWRRDPTSQNSPQSNLPTPKDTVDKGSNVNKGSDRAIESQFPDTKVVTEKADGPSASELPPSGEKNRKDESNEVDEDSEFEQKTMTVMRGGELVQVSYKVKIPKKARALARRQLKRPS